MVTRDDWVVSLEMEADGEAFLLWMDHSGAFQTGFPGTLGLFKGKVESQRFAVSYAIRSFELCARITHLHVSQLFAVLAFYLGLFRKSQEGGEERKRRMKERDGVSSLLTSTCHRGSLGACSLPQVARSHLLKTSL